MYTYCIQATTLFTSAYTSLRSVLDGLVSIKVINLAHVKLLSSLCNIPMIRVYGWIRAVQEIDASTCAHTSVHTIAHASTSSTVHASGLDAHTSGESALSTVHTGGLGTTTSVHTSSLNALTSTHTSGLGASTNIQYSTNNNVDYVMSSSELSTCCQLVINLLESFRS